ncbi:MAG: TonB-dependent receptor SusC [Formosa sp. Hel3_A1_48]|nr:MAG: TonB-dependent receptor SusC [Formosa sp. Hel3_A1_48]
MKNKIKIGITLIAILISSIAMGQRTITGSIKDANGEPLPGATVIIKDTNKGASSDIDGNYKIRISDDNTVLIYSYLGHVSQEVVVGARSKLDIIMMSDSEELGEVLISTGYRTISKAQSTGAYATVDSKKLDKIVSSSILDKLDGQLPGVSIQDGKIVIRGQNTFNTKNPEITNSNTITSNPLGVKLADGSQINYRNNPSRPLIIIDGFPFEGNIDDLDQNDIENVSTLKDAASASIWGSKAANGVIVITRKKATKEEGRLSFRFDTFLSISDEINIDDYNFIPAYKAFDFEQIVLDSLGERTLLSNKIKSTSALENIYYRRDVLNELTWPQADELIQKLRMQSNYAEGQDAFLRQAITKNYNFQLSHSSGKLSNIVLMNYTDNETSYVGNKNNKINVGLRSQYKFTDWLDLGFNYNAILSNETSNSMARYFVGGRLRPYEHFADASGNYLAMGDVGGNLGVSYKVRREYEAKGYQPWHWNPIEEQRNNDIGSSGKSHTMQFSADLKLPYGFSYSGKLQYRYRDTDKVLSYNRNSYEARHMINTFTNYEGEVAGIPILKYNVPIGGGIRQNSLSKYTSTNFRNMLNYNHTKDKHSISASVGTDLLVSDTQYDTNTILGYNKFSGNHGTRAINLRDLTIDAATESLPYTYDGAVNRLSPYINSTGFTKNRDFSIFGFGGYTYDNKYHLSGSGRIEKSNLTGSDKSNYLWSVGGAWTVSNESFYSGISETVNYLKLRGSYGYTGNVDRSALPFLRGKRGLNIGSGIEYLDITEPSNPDLKMERTRNINVGVDASLFDSRITLSADYYTDFSTNLIVAQRVDPTFRGWTSAKENNGSISNKGLDLRVDARIIERENFQWSSTLNLGFNKGKVVDYQVDKTASYYKQLLEGKLQAPGYAYNSIFTFKSGGLDANGNPTIYLGGEKVSTELLDENGSIVEGWDKIDLNDLQNHGSAIPTTYGGLFNTLSYKQFDLSFNINYSLGGYMYMPKANLEYKSTTIHTKEVLQAWQQSGDELQTAVPRMVSTEASTDPYYSTVSGNNFKALNNHNEWYQYSDQHIEKSDVIRLRYITLGYNFDNAFVKQIGMESLRINLQVENIAYWASNSRNLDPSYMNRPNPKTITLGIYTQF